MKTIADLHGVRDDEVQRLRAAGVGTADQLLAKAPDLAGLAAASGIAAERLAELLARYCENEVTRTVQPAGLHLRGYAWHLALVSALAVAGLAVALLVVWPIAALVPKPAKPPAPKLAADSVVLTVRLAAPPTDPPKTPFRATLRASSRINPPRPPVRVDGLVLALHPSGPEATADVALPAADAGRLDAALATSQVYLSYSPSTAERRVP